MMMQIYVARRLGDHNLCNLYVITVEASSESTSVNSHKNQDSDGSGSGFQPPAVLRKWQRQRVREEYMFESDDSPQIYNQIKFSSTMPQPSSERQLVEDGQVRKDDMILNKASASYSAALQSQPPLAAPRHTFNLSSERQKMQEWEQRQEDERQVTNSYKLLSLVPLVLKNILRFIK